MPFAAPLYMVLVGIKRIAGAEPTVQGHSFGHWEGETLAVDTASFAPHRLGLAAGLPSGSGKHLVERFEPTQGGSSLVYRFTVEDHAPPSRLSTIDVRMCRSVPSARPRLSRFLGAHTGPAIRALFVRSER